MIGVGINENVVLSSKTALDDKGGLNIVFAEKSSGSLYAAMIGGESVEPADVMLKQFVTNTTKADKSVKTPLEVAKELQGLTEVLIDILKEHMPEDKAKVAIDLKNIYASVGITAANEAMLLTKLIEQEFVNVVFKSICQAFINAMAPLFDKTPLRVKLRRSSTASHFPRIPYKGKFPEVWIESMQIPTAASKIAWSQWEIDNKINDGTPVKADAESKPDTSAADAAFGGAPAAVAPLPIPGTEPTPAPNVAAPVGSPVAGEEQASVGLPF